MKRGRGLPGNRAGKTRSKLTRASNKGTGTGIKTGDQKKAAPGKNTKSDKSKTLIRGGIFWG